MKLRLRVVNQQVTSETRAADGINESSDFFAMETSSNKPSARPRSKVRNTFSIFRLRIKLAIKLLLLWSALLGQAAAAIAVKMGPTTDSESLQGRWRVVAARNNKNLQQIYIFKGNRLWRGKTFDEQRAVEFALNVDETPKTIDFRRGDKLVGRGLYELGLNQLMLCSVGASEPRPRTMRLESDAPDTLVLLERMTENPDAPQPPFDFVRVQIEKERLRGTWQVVREVRSGKEVNLPEKPQYWVFKDEQIIHRRQFETNFYRFDVEPTTLPRTIGLGHQVALYRFADGQLSICLPDADNIQCPSKFLSDGEHKNVIWTLEPFVYRPKVPNPVTLKDIQAINGTWDQIELISNEKRKDVPSGVVQWTFGEAKLIISYNGKPFECQFHLEATKYPKTIDWGWLDNVENPASKSFGQPASEAFYDLEGDTLRISFIGNSDTLPCRPSNANSKDATVYIFQRRSEKNGDSVENEVE